MNYSLEINNLFNSPKHVFNDNIKYNFMGFAGDQDIGEFINVYILLEKNQEIYKSIIVNAAFSAIGSVFLIAAAEKFCSLINGSTLEKAIECCNLDKWIITIPENRKHSANFIIQAFYLVVENIMSNNV